MFNGYSAIPLNDETLKDIYLTLNKLKDGALNNKHQKNFERQINMLKECIIKRKENEIICAFMF